MRRYANNPAIGKKTKIANIHQRLIFFLANVLTSLIIAAYQINPKTVTDSTHKAL
ncbi:MAG: hypothetical protein MJ219_02285 [Mycoplasmoidaceae bacterium]|nr:hypothetical protein [Mycoplasmoidaceae bacterium]